METKFKVIFCIVIVMATVVNIILFIDGDIFTDRIIARDRRLYMLSIYLVATLPLIIIEKICKNRKRKEDRQNQRKDK